MVPTKERNQVATLMLYKRDGILIDCGEGTQRQMKLYGIPLSKLTKILVSHWHGDHILGLLGIIQSLGSLDYEKTLEIYAPKGTKKYFEDMCKGIVFDFRIKTKFVEVDSGIICEDKDFTIESLPLKHKIACNGYSFIEKDKRKINMEKLKKIGVEEGPHIRKLQEGKTLIWKDKVIKPEEVTTIVKGKKITFITDTVITNNCYKLAENADILVIESSYTSKLKDKAEKYKHLTAQQSALIASKSDVKKLILTHFSARYKNTQEIEEEARNYFDNIICAYDGMKINI